MPHCTNGRRPQRPHIARWTRSRAGKLERVLECGSWTTGWTTLSREEVEAERALYGPFTQSLRELVDAAIRTTVPDDEVRRAHAEIEAITERLRSAPMRTTYGVDLRTDGRGRAWGNAVVGLRNASRRR